MANQHKLGAQSLPIVYAKGTYYEVGYCIGHTFAKRINDWFEDSIGPIIFFRRFYDDADGKMVVEQYLETTEKAFPEYVQEMRGMADGSGAKFHDIFLANLLTEICFCHKDITDRIGNLYPEDTKNKEEKEIAGCTDVYVNRTGLRILAHNEDGEPGSERYNYFAAVTIVDEEDRSQILEEFITYMYAGMVPGFSCNATKEFVITCNSLVPQACNHKGVPSAFVIRKLLSCKSIEEMSSIVKCEPYGIAYGFNLNIAEIQGTEMWSMEVVARETGTDYLLHEIPMASDTGLCHYFHCNTYKHITTEELAMGEGSIARGKRCEELPPPRVYGDVTNILGDTANSKYPIYRGEDPTVYTAKTVCTALFNITERKVFAYLDNPKQNKPFAVIPFL